MLHILHLHFLIKIFCDDDNNFIVWIFNYDDCLLQTHIMTLPPQYTTRKNELFWLWLIMLKLYLKEKEWQKRYMCIHLTTRPFVLALESTPETKLPLWLGWLLELPRQGWDNPHCISWGEKKFVEIYPSEYYSSINWYVERMTQIIGCYVFLTKKNMHFFLLMGWMFCCLGVKTKHSVRVFLFFCFLFWKPVWIWAHKLHIWPQPTSTTHNRR